MLCPSTRHNSLAAANLKTKAAAQQKKETGALKFEIDGQQFKLHLKASICTC